MSAADFVNLSRNLGMSRLSRISALHFRISPRSPLTQRGAAGHYPLPLGDKWGLEWIYGPR